MAASYEGSTNEAKRNPKTVNNVKGKKLKPINATLVCVAKIGLEFFFIP